MAQFKFVGERIAIVDDTARRLDLNPQEALDLLQWLSEHRDALYSLAHQNSAQRQAREKRLEIHLYQENLEHVDKLKAAIPSLHEHTTPVFKILDAPMDVVTERALELLAELQVEYKIHPLLEEDNSFSQG